MTKVVLKTETTIMNMNILRKFAPTKTGALLAAGIVLSGGFAAAQTTTFSRQLELGSRGADVSRLQALLATDPSVYPQGLVTGYFGGLSKAAIEQFQAGYGIPVVGRVGPMTLARLNGLAASGFDRIDTMAPIISSPMATVSQNNVTVTWNTSELTRAKVHYAEGSLSMTEAAGQMAEPGVSGTVVQDNALSMTHSVRIPNLGSGRLYQYVIVAADAQGNVSMTMPATFTTQ